VSQDGVDEFAVARAALRQQHRGLGFDYKSGERMSTTNILSKVPILRGDIPVGVTVTFSTNRGTSFSSYDFYGRDAAMIMGGADPAMFQGQRTA
jgi:hypothetical protein